MKKWIALAVFGLLLLIASFWGGAWLCSRFPVTGKFALAAPGTTWVMIMVSIGVIALGVGRAAYVAENGK